MKHAAETAKSMATGEWRRTCILSLLLHHASHCRFLSPLLPGSFSLNLCQHLPPGLLFQPGPAAVPLGSCACFNDCPIRKKGSNAAADAGSCAPMLQALASSSRAPRTPLWGPSRRTPRRTRRAGRRTAPLVCSGKAEAGAGSRRPSARTGVRRMPALLPVWRPAAGSRQRWLR